MNKESWGERERERRREREREREQGKNSIRLCPNKMSVLGKEVGSEEQ